MLVLQEIIFFELVCDILLKVRWFWIDGVWKFLVMCVQVLRLLVIWYILFRFQLMLLILFLVMYGLLIGVFFCMVCSMLVLKFFLFCVQCMLLCSLKCLVMLILLEVNVVYVLLCWVCMVWLVCGLFGVSELQLKLLMVMFLLKQNMLVCQLKWFYLLDFMWNFCVY